jgi:hypothetical protein
VSGGSNAGRVGGVLAHYSTINDFVLLAVLALSYDLVKILPTLTAISIFVCPAGLSFRRLSRGLVANAILIACPPAGRGCMPIIVSVVGPSSLRCPQKHPIKVIGPEFVDGQNRAGIVEFWGMAIIRSYRLN